MKTSKKILIIIASLLVVSIISILISFVLNLLFEVSILGSFLLMTAIQIIGSMIYDRYIESAGIKNALEEYLKKPYREHQLTLPCQFCGKEQLTKLDFNNLEFTCENCGGQNGIHIEFRTAAISKFRN